MRIAIACLLVLLLCAPVFAIELVRDVSTGYDNAAGAVIAGGQPDDEYTISPPGGLAAHVITEQWPIAPAGPWIANSATSKWVGWDAPSSNADPGDYEFTTTVSLGGADPAKTRLAGAWTSDNAGLDVLINGSSTGASQDGNFTVLHSLGILGGGLFQAGDNTITFRINNAPGDPPAPGPSGLRVEAGLYEYTGLPDTFDFDIYNTGVDDDGIPLAEDAVDPHWTLHGAGGATEGQGPEAYATTGAGGFPVGPWLSDSADLASAWIAPDPTTNAPDGGIGDPPPFPNSIYEYSTTFTTPMAGTVTIAGLQSADGGLAGIELDGVAGTFTPIGFDTFADFSVTAEVTGTEHTLTFLVDNGTGAGPNPTGLRVSIDTATFVPIPEPSALILVTIGLVGLGLYGWRRTRTA